MRRVRFNLPLHSSRTTIRSLQSSDLKQFHQYRADPIVALYQDWSPMSEEQALEFLLETSAAQGLAPGKWVQLGIALPKVDLLVGDIGLFLDEDLETAEIGFTLAREYQGTGLATEAVDLVIEALSRNTDVRNVRGVTDARNTASIRLLRRVDFFQVSERKAMIRDEACTEYVFERRIGVA